MQWVGLALGSIMLGAVVLIVVSIASHRKKASKARPNSLSDHIAEDFKFNPPF